MPCEKWGPQYHCESKVFYSPACLLKPLHDEYGVKRVICSTYQATSGAGQAGMDELFNRTKGIFVNDEQTPEKFTKQIAFNVIPHIDVFMDDGFTKEEWKMRAETKKIMDESIEVIAHAVRVPVFVGHSEAVFVETEKSFEIGEVRNQMREQDGLSVIDHRANEGYVTPVEAAGEDAVFISRLRRDPSVENGMVFWCVSDNLRKGAALNSVQIAETVVEEALSASHACQLSSKAACHIQGQRAFAIFDHVMG